MQLGTPGGVELAVMFSLVAIIVGIPTWGMYRESTKYDDDHAYVWTGAMFVISILAPIIGSIILWILYTVIVVGE